MWVRFLETFSFKPKPQVTIVYEPGQVKNVPRACGEKAITKGKAVRLYRYNKADGFQSQIP